MIARSQDGEQGATGSFIVADELNRLDRDMFLASLFLPDKVRYDVQVLWTLAAELSLVRLRVTAPLPGEIRFQWWLEVLNRERDGEARSSSLASAVLSIIDRHNVSVKELVQMIEARRFDLYDEPMENAARFEHYAFHTRAILFRFAAMISQRPDGDLDALFNVANDLGVAAAYVEHIRSFLNDCASGKIYLPYSVFHSFGLDEDSVKSAVASPELDAAMHAHLETACEYVSNAEVRVNKLPRDMRRNFVYLAFLKHQCRVMSDKGTEFFNAPLHVMDWRKLWSGFRFLIKR